MKNAILLFVLCLPLLYSSCEKQIPIVEVPLSILVPIPLSSRGSLEYIHSMFVVNNECWGENRPQYALLNQNRTLIEVSFRGKYRVYDRQSGISEDQNYSNKKKFAIFYSISMGDGLIESYSNLFHIDSAQSIQLKFNQDSTELDCKIKDLTLTTSGKSQLPYIPEKVVISEVSGLDW